MANNEAAVDEIINSISPKALPDANTIQEYNSIFRALGKHGYQSEAEKLKDWIIQETQVNEYDNTPGTSKVCRQIVTLTGVDEELEEDLPRQF